MHLFNELVLYNEFLIIYSFHYNVLNLEHFVIQRSEKIEFNCSQFDDEKLVKRVNFLIIFRKLTKSCLITFKCDKNIASINLLVYGNWIFVKILKNIHLRCILIDYDLNLRDDFAISIKIFKSSDYTGIIVLNKSEFQLDSLDLFIIDFDFICIRSTRFTNGIEIAHSTRIYKLNSSVRVKFINNSLVSYNQIKIYNKNQYDISFWDITNLTKNQVKKIKFKNKKFLSNNELWGVNSIELGNKKFDLNYSHQINPNCVRINTKYFLFVKNLRIFDESSDPNHVICGDYLISQKDYFFDVYQISTGIKICKLDHYYYKSSSFKYKYFMNYNTFMLKFIIDKKSLFFNFMDGKFKFVASFEKSAIFEEHECSIDIKMQFKCFKIFYYYDDYNLFAMDF